VTWENTYICAGDAIAVFPRLAVITYHTEMSKNDTTTRSCLTAVQICRMQTDDLTWGWLDLSPCHD